MRVLFLRCGKKTQRRSPGVFRPFRMHGERERSTGAAFCKDAWGKARRGAHNKGHERVPMALKRRYSSRVAMTV